MLSPIEILEKERLHYQQIVDHYSADPELMSYAYKEVNPLIDYIRKLQRAIDLLKQKQNPVDIDDYDCGLINDFGGGDVNWWQDYLRSEIGKCNECWRKQKEG